MALVKNAATSARRCIVGRFLSAPACEVRGTTFANSRPVRDITWAGHPHQCRRFAASPAASNDAMVASTPTTPELAGAAPTSQGSPMEEDDLGVELPIVERLGEGDHVVELNVGGKTFIALKSTVQVSPILAYHIAAAEEHEGLKMGKAVFIDRDPEHFAVILNFLRSKAAETGPRRCVVQELRKVSSLTLPKDYNKLKDLFVEAKYYGLHDLAKIACGQRGLSKFYSLAGGLGNPLDGAARLAVTLRRAAVVFSGLLGGGLLAAAPGRSGDGQAGQVNQNSVSIAMNGTADSIEQTAKYLVNVIDHMKQVK
mmetsp:Transcript_52559/g.114775  ORF Transcript_52559/g.114775 Transcript_52559/m.114775 type:complete len:312 (-) Transcript_52559:285-1220(-)|eukprot:CAMPEP_0206439284 /NCGR_PEP_ID=MMETSP0324_2-20121206/12118_1 /ASSEMBLY_ACC=CAM_ASM_000836 /TAXON_ID=2866 /ORGANISM="Crypthecodinium cohnii, Strain Seligo" /LENGTH=311 /DNA_ID=CAMNT_0053906873 /DNA_START=286 /DNA_END=1221 /DNA_ORIENTATION=-